MTDQSDGGAPPTYSNGANGANGVHGSRPSFAEEQAAMTEFAPPQLDRADLRRWLAEQCSPARRTLQCEGFVLAHVSAQGKEQRLDFATIAKKLDDAQRDVEVERVTERFARAAINHARTIGPFRQAYAVLSGFTSDPLLDCFMSYPFPVTPPPAAAAGTRFDARAPVDNGVDHAAINGNVMRQNEVLMRQLCSTVQVVIERMADSEQRSRDREERIAQQREQLWLEREKLHDMKSEREDRSYRERKEADLQHQLMTGGLEYLKAFGSRYMAERFGPGVIAEFGQTVEPIQLMLILENLSDAQREKFKPIASSIVDGFDENKRAQFQQMLLARQEAKTQEEQAKLEAKRVGEQLLAAHAQQQAVTQAPAPAAADVQPAPHPRSGEPTSHEEAKASLEPSPLRPEGESESASASEGASERATVTDAATTKTKTTRRRRARRTQGE